MDNQRTKKICITGGHLSPAVAVIEEIQKQKLPWDIMVVGRLKTSHTSVTTSEEKTVIEKMNIPFFSIHAGRITRFFSLQTLRELCFIPVGFVESIVFCLKKKPDCIVSFGGYVGLPMIVSGWLLGIPTVIHEQTHMLGLSNTIASEFADTILLTFPDEKKQQDKRVLVTGLPLRSSFIDPPKNVSIPIVSNKPIVYITGGTTGAVSMNELVFPIIGELVKKYMVIHQTGQQSYAKALTVLASIAKEQRMSYVPTPYIEDSDVSWIMHHALLIVGRSGANTVAEVSALHLPAVFIPLPWAGRQEQRRNATWYAGTGGQVNIVDQQNTTSDELLRMIEDMAQTQGKEHQQRTVQSASASAIVQSIVALV